MAETKPSKTTKRRLRPATTTVREKAEKAQTNTDKPARKQPVRKAATRASRPFKRVGKAFDRQPFRFIGRILYPRFLRNAIKELRLVTWPDRKQTRQLTFAVLMFAVVFGVTIAIVDYGLDKLFRAIILK